MATQDLGQVLTAPYPVPEGTAQLYERGIVLNRAGSEVVVEFRLPMIGRPHIATGAAPALLAAAVRFGGGHHDLSALGPVVQAALAGRMGLVPTGEQATPVPLAVGPVEVVEPERPTGVGGVVIAAVYGVPLSGSLGERQLYDVALAGDGGWRTVAPHAVYHRGTWTDFGLAHVTDTHVARRIDRFRPTLYDLGRPEAAARMYNWNDRFRGFIRYANYLHGIGALDVILATGDLYDYQFEYDDDENGQGNALFLRNLILGRAPGPDFPDVEELRVPIFMVPGNHDYRKYPYHLIFNLDYLGHHRFRNYEPYHLQSGDALALWTGLYGGVEDGVPDLDKDSAARMVAIDPHLRPYRECLADGGSFVVRLGAHRIVMLDSAHDVGVLTSGLDGIRAYLHFASEDELTFAGGSPNCDGVSEAELKLSADALSGTADGGLFILGIHAPLFNLWSNELPYFLRETQRPTQPGQDIGFLARHGGKPLPVPSAVDEFVREHWPLWFPGDQDHRKPVFVKRGGTQDLMDYGVSRGHTEDLVRLLAGIGSRRPADVVLSGHTHFHNEFVVGRTGTGDELAYLMDFYTHNPTFYYPTRYTTSFKGQSDGHTIVTREVTYVEVDADATADATPWPMPYAAQHAKQLQVPPSPAPLSQSQDPRAWWAAHRPLILQTGALGPMENNQVSFSGFRLLSVAGDVIDKVHSISIGRLEAHAYRLALEDAVRPDPPRRYRHIERARRDHAPEARGAPAAINLPTLGGNSVVYRDAQGHLDELWKGNGGDRATGDATANAGAPAAAGDPSIFFEAPIGNLLTIYRSADGHVHDLYWSTGAVGHDNITGSIGAPRAAGEPRGALLADGINHVIYRTGDGHLHALWWTGGSPAGHEDMTAGLSAPPAAGDPSPWLDTTRGRNHLAYRATDGHVRGFYWNGGSDGHEDLSGFAGAPNAAGDPVAYYLPGHDLHQITYRGIDHHLWEVYCVGEESVSAWDLTVSASAPPADSDPAVYYSAASDTKHVIYRSADGHLHEIWWVVGAPPAHVDLTVEALAPPAVDRPAAFTIDGPNSQHVIYRGTDNQIHEITRQTSAWPGPNTVADWRWCNKCQGMFWGGNVTISRCPAGNTHTPPDQSGSRNYILPFNMALV